MCNKDMAQGLTWESLVRLEPRLQHLMDEAARYRRHKGYCANAVWYGYGGGLKGKLLGLVGWHRAQGPEVLQTCEAYDLAYQTIYDNLPDCRHAPNLGCF